MKTSRRGWFKLLLAPAVAPIVALLAPKPDPNIVAFVEARIAAAYLERLNGFEEAINDGLNPDWDGEIDTATYGSIQRNG